MMKLNKSIILLVALTAMLFSSCREHHVAQHHVAVDSLINIVYQARNYDSILSLADLHQQEGTLSNIEACYWRGYAYSRLRKIRMAEIEWKRAVAQTIETDEDLIYYAQSANRLTGLLYLKAEYGEAIQVALPAIRLLKEPTRRGCQQLHTSLAGLSADHEDRPLHQQLHQFHRRTGHHCRCLYTDRTLPRGPGMDRPSGQYAATVSRVAWRA